MRVYTYFLYDKYTGRLVYTIHLMSDVNRLGDWTVVGTPIREYEHGGSFYASGTEQLMFGIAEHKASFYWCRKKVQTY